MADEGRKQLYTLALYTLHEDNTNVSVRDGSNTGTSCTHKQARV